MISMYRCKKDHFTYIVFDKLAAFPNLVHGIFLKDHDFANPKIHSEQILKQWSLQSLAYGGQVHGTHVSVVKNAKEQQQIFPVTDALMTCQKGVALMILHADCQAGLVYDPKNQAIAAVHSGWRGSSQNIFGKVLRAMEEAFGSRPGDLQVCIGPSLGPFAAEFKNYAQELPPTFLPYKVRTNYFDFWTISQRQLIDAGVLKQNIEIMGLCTYSNPTYCYSYRRNKDARRHASFIALVD